MGLDEERENQKSEWQEPRPFMRWKAKSQRQALYCAPARTICRDFLELLYFPWLSMTCSIFFNRFKYVQWYTAHLKQLSQNLLPPKKKKKKAHSSLQWKYSCQLLSMSFLAQWWFTNVRSQMRKSPMQSTHSYALIIPIGLLPFLLSFLHSSFSSFLSSLLLSFLRRFTDQKESDSQVSTWNIVHCVPDVRLETVVMAVVSAVWPACVTVMDTKHVMSIFSHIYELNIKDFILAWCPTGHSKVPHLS